METDLLRSFYLFRGAAAEDLATVASLLERQRHGAGKTIFREGDEPEAMYLVELGTVEILLSENETVIAMVGSGGEFGELAFFDQGRRSATARTREVCEIVRLPYDALRRTMSERPSLASVVHRNACAFLAKLLRQTSTDLSFARELNRRRL